MTDTSTSARRVRSWVLVHALGLWVVMALLASTNGIFREIVLVPTLGERPAHLLSTALLVTAIVAVVVLYVTRVERTFRRVELVFLGVAWVLLTVPFEFVIGYIDEIPPEETLAQYDVLAGEVWILVPLALLLAPIVIGSRVQRDRR